METLIVSLIFFLITAGLSFFPFAVALWGKGGEGPKVFVLSGVLAMVSAAANILLVHRKSAGKALPRILASLGLTLAFWMITYPLYQKKFCPVCLFTQGGHPVKLVAGVMLLALGVMIFVIGWRVTGWGNHQAAQIEESRN